MRTELRILAAHASSPQPDLGFRRTFSVSTCCFAKKEPEDELYIWLRSEEVLLHC